MRLPAVLLLSLAAFAPGETAFAAETFSTLEERMTDEEFRAAGLDRLSAEELANLNAWLARRNVSTRPAPAGGSQGFKPDGLCWKTASRGASPTATSASPAASPAGP